MQGRDCGGGQGTLYVVLPTGVETPLPFACNAPFIQDPARLKIKDPETSPTNRWLLERVGQLAATVMLEWLSLRRAVSRRVQKRIGVSGRRPRRHVRWKARVQRPLKRHSTRP